MYPIITENEAVSVTEQYFTMPDGVKLYTRIATPKKQGKFPIVFMRTPYEKAHNGVAHDISEYDQNPFIQNGYAVVLQHCRGRGDSEGICVPYAEREDGLNSLSLIRKLDIYDHEIYLYGGSYLSTVHLCYLDTNPEDVRGAVLNIQTDRMYFRNYRNGCCYDFCNLDWWLSMIDRQYPHQDRNGTVIRPYRDIMKRVLGEDYPPYTGLLINDQFNDFWRKDPRTYVVESLQIPVLFAEGWYDFYLEGMFSMWERMPQAAKSKSAFIVGPWGHGTAVSEKAEYPLPNGNIPADFAVEWFNCLRANRLYPYAETGKVTYYTIGEDAWKTRSFPTSESKAMRLYFGDHNALTPSPCQTGKSISYVYDPDKRLNCFPYLDIYKAFPIGGVDGVVSFQSREFDEEKSFFGKIRWHMRVSSDCEDTAFFIRVYLVENGEAYNLTETITSLSHICPQYRAGEEMTIDLLTPPVAFAVKRGGKIRVDISSDGGVYVPHANVKGQWAEVCYTKIANNTVFLQDSFIELDME